MKQTTSLPACAPTPLNTDSGLLRTIALVTMIIDHVGVIFFPGVSEIRIIGRIAFPLFCWGIVLGAMHSRNLMLYAGRLFLGAILSQGPYMLALNHQWYELNVMFTLGLGLLAIVGIKENRFYSAWWAPLLALLLSSVFRMDYGWKGVLFIVFMYLCKDSKPAFIAMMVSFCMFWGNFSSDVSNLFGITITNTSPIIWQRLYSLVSPFLRMQAFAFLALPLIAINTHSKIKIGKFFGYIAYPGHLLILYVLKLLLL